MYVRSLRVKHSNQCMIGPKDTLVYLSAKDVQRGNSLAKYLRQSNLPQAVEKLVRLEKRITDIDFDLCFTVADLPIHLDPTFCFKENGLISHQSNFLTT